MKDFLSCNDPEYSVQSSCFVLNNVIAYNHNISRPACNLKTPTYTADYVESITGILNRNCTT
jgi:hypothetical protein